MQQVLQGILLVIFEIFAWRTQLCTSIRRRTNVHSLYLLHQLLLFMHLILLFMHPYSGTQEVQKNQMRNTQQRALFGLGCVHVCFELNSGRKKLGPGQIT
ncbi:hypothetical protein I7I50_09257 [Histoplasma capsulatum G186AR]|uniref:Uncharacterized protein n=1 Tax=Ajellomyces capsulatus TaxID=5037 RepID=A0A8H8D0A0_AJECA|nr:hypothetical protein I7I52_06778 [Histoplasma capsulatum]QSS74189.1 hypothetical protein I7I50_09257 [Histoplasma capsulatum G186AR]